MPRGAVRLLKAEAGDLPAAHYRLCYNRAGENWRLRDEESGELRLVTDYEGDANFNWQDGGSHVFHDGPVHIDDDLVAHFIDPKLVDVAETAATG